MNWENRYNIYNPLRVDLAWQLSKAPKHINRRILITQ